MRRLNVKFLLVLLSLIFGGGLISYFAWARNVNRNAELFLELAGEAQGNGENEKALRFVRQFLSISPDNLIKGHASSLSELTIVLNEVADTPIEKKRMLAVLDKLVQKGVRDQGIRFLLIDHLIFFERFDEARTEINRIHDEDLGGPALNLKLAECHLGQGDPDEAANVVLNALQNDATLIEGYSRLAHLLLFSLKRPLVGTDASPLPDWLPAEARESQAEALIVRMISLNQDNYKSYLERGRYYKAQQRFDEARADFVTSAKMNENDLEVTIELAETVVSAVAGTGSESDATLARALIQKGLRLAPNDYRLYLLSAGLSRMLGDFEEAIGVLRTGLATHPDSPHLNWAIGDVLISRGEAQDLAEVDSIIERLPELGVSSASQSFLVGSKHFQSKQYVKCVDVLETARPELEAIPEQQLKIDLMLGACHHILLSAEQELRAYRRAAQLAPSSAPTLQLLAGALERKGRIGEALGVYSRLSSIDSDKFGIQAIRLRIRQDLDAGINQDWPLKLQEIADILQSNPGDTLARALEIECLIYSGAIEQASERVQLAIADFSKEIRFRILHAIIKFRRGDKNGAIALLEESEREFEENVPLLVAQADFWSTEVDSAGAIEKLIVLEKRSEKHSVENLFGFYKRMARTYARHQDEPSATRMWKAAFAVRESDIEVCLELFKLALARVDKVAARNWLGEIVRVESGRPFISRYAKALDLMTNKEAGNGGEARRILLELRSERPDWIPVHLSLGYSSLALGNHPEAASSFLRAIDLGNRSVTLIQQTIELLVEQARIIESQGLLQRLKREGAISGAIQGLASDVFARSNEKESALVSAQEAVVFNPRDPRNHIRLGRAFEMLGNPEQAEQAFRESVALQPNALEPWIALVSFLVREERMEDVNAEVVRAEKQISGERRDLYLAQIYDLSGQLQRAEEMYEQIVADESCGHLEKQAAAMFYLRNGNRDAAIALLRSVLREEDLGQGVVSSTRRTLALATVVNSSPSYEEFRYALGLLESNLKTFRSTTDLRMKVLVLLSRPAGFRQQVIDTLREIQRISSLSEEDRLLLCDLAVQVGDDDLYADHIQALLGTGKKRYIELHVLRLLKQNQDPPDVWINQLDFENLELIELKVRLVSKSDLARAGRLVTDYVSDNPDTVLPFARLAEELKMEEAKTLFAQQNDLFELAQFHARNGRLSLALDLCGRQIESGAIGVVELARNALSILYSARPRDSIKQHDTMRVEKWISEARAEDPKNAGLHELVAMNRILSGQYREAVAIYMDLAKDQKIGAAGLNNLAWLASKGFGDTRKSLEIIDAAIDAAGPLPEFLETRSSVNLANGLKQQALTDIQRALDDQINANRLLIQAVVYKSLGMDREAENSFDRAEQVGLIQSNVHPLDMNDYDELIKMREFARN